MEKNNMTNKRLVNMMLAYEIQQIANPYLNEGSMSLSCIYLNHIAGKIPICMNTFRKMMKEDVSEFPELVKAYQANIQLRYLERLHRQSRKRIKG